MPVRVLLSLLFIIVTVCPWSRCLAEEDTPLVVTTDTAATPPTPAVTPPAREYLQMKYPFLSADAKPMTLTVTASGLSYTPHGVATLAEMHDVVLSTCDRARDHQHFDLRAKTFTVFPDQSYEARHITLEVGGHRVLGFARLRGDMPGSDDGGGLALPSVSFGASQLDGNYAKLKTDFAVGQRDTLNLSARIGTSGNPRGRIAFTRPVTLSDRLGGTGELSLVTAWREDVENRMVNVDDLSTVDMEDLTVSRLPALVLTLRGIPLGTRGATNGFQLRGGAAVGRYTEEPTHVSNNRGQVWGVVSTPRYALGRLRLYGELGARQAIYSGSTHNAYVTLVSLETPETADVYANLSYLRRREAGTTPFLFDRVLIPDELSSEVEFPLGKQSPWRLGLANRQDLTYGKSREFTVTTTYSNDCFTYGLSYDFVGHDFGLGMVINGLGSFRKGIRHIAFTQ